MSDDRQARIELSKRAVHSTTYMREDMSQTTRSQGLIRKERAGRPPPTHPTEPCLPHPTIKNHSHPGQLMNVPADAIAMSKPSVCCLRTKTHGQLLSVGNRVYLR